MIVRFFNVVIVTGDGGIGRSTFSALNVRRCRLNSNSEFGKIARFEGFASLWRQRFAGGFDNPDSRSDAPQLFLILKQPVELHTASPFEFQQKRKEAKRVEVKRLEQNVALRRYPD
jgi:hypothetical protein